jgi:hypothetical protein
MIKEALDYVKAGYSIIPLNPRSKIPLVEWREFQTKRPTVDQVSNWFIDHERNIAIITGAVSGLVVVDVDEVRGGKVQELIDRFPTNMIAKTGKGYHLYYSYPGWNVENRVDILPGVDIRGDGGFVVAPPSIHANGTTYSWIDEIPR